MKTFGGHDFSFGVLRKTVLEWLVGGEAGFEYPWEADLEELGTLALPPGVVWPDGGRKTLRMTYVPYELGTGLAPDMNGQPGTFQFARFYRLFVDATDGLPFTVAHPMGVFPPQVHLVERIVGIVDTWRVYDIHGAGGTIDYELDNETIAIDPAAAWQGYVTIVG